MRPGVIPGVVDLPRAIAELKDFATMWKHGANSLAAVRSGKRPSDFLKEFDRGYADFMRKTVRKNGIVLHKTVDELIGTLIAADLTYKFAIKPLLEDIAGVCKAFAKLEETMTSLAHPQPFRVYGKASDSDTSDYGETQLQLFKKQLAGTVKRDVRTWAICRRDVVDLSVLDTMRRLLKLDLRARTLWDLTPLSFVCDWFVRVGDFIGQFDPETLSLPYRVLASGASVKDTFTLTSQKTMFSGVSWVVPSGLVTVSGKHFKTVYTRTPMELPWTDNAINPIKFGLPSLDKVGTLIEILNPFRVVLKSRSRKTFV